jgi:hypothetical protein
MLHMQKVTNQKKAKNRDKNYQQRVRARAPLRKGIAQRNQRRYSCRTRSRSRQFPIIQQRTRSVFSVHIESITNSTCFAAIATKQKHVESVIAKLDIYCVDTKCYIPSISPHCSSGWHWVWWMCTHFCPSCFPQQRILHSQQRSHAIVTSGRQTHQYNPQLLQRPRQ